MPDAFIADWEQLSASTIAAQIRAVGSSFPPTFVVTLLAVSLILYSSFSSGHFALVCAASSVIIAVSLITFLSWRRNNARDWCIEDAANAQRYLCVQAASTSFGWYLLLTIADFAGRGANRDILDCIMAGVLAAGALRFAAVPLASIFFVVTGIFSIFVYAILERLSPELLILLCLFTLLLIRSVLNQARLFLENQRATRDLIDAAIAREQSRAAEDQAILGRARHDLEIRRQAASERARELDGIAVDFERSVVELIADLGDRARRGGVAAQSLAQVTARSVDTSTNLLDKVRETTIGSETLTTSARSLNTALLQLKARIGEQTSATQYVQDSFTANQQAAERLNDRAGEVSKIVGLIADIAARTNLLALNASIEAARAGDAGRGFSVVAQEVKSLAAQTRSATDAVSQQVETIVAVIAEVTASLSTIHDGFGSVHRLAETLDTTMIGQQAVMASLTARAHGAELVNAALDEAASDAATASDQASSLSQDLSRATADIVERSAAVLAATSCFTQNLRKTPDLSVA